MYIFNNDLNEQFIFHIYIMYHIVKKKFFLIYLGDNYIIIVDPFGFLAIFSPISTYMSNLAVI